MVMEDEKDTTNWLRAAVIECPNCHVKLHRVDHSPMMDDYVLYCDSCPNSVEVSFYDPTMMELQDKLLAHNQLSRKQLMAEVQDRLRLCTCGGHFKDDAPRRCHICSSEVIIGERGVDLMPASLMPTKEGDFELILEQMEEWALFDERFIRRADIWK